MIAFLCSGCGKSLKVKDEFAGRKGKCPHCQEPMTVPSSSDTARDGVSSADAKTILPDSMELDRDSKTILPAVPRGNTSLKKSNSGTAATPSVANHKAELCDFLAPAQEKDEIGRLGSYRVLKILGAGGMGVVFQAEDPKLHRLVALKAMLPALAASGTNKERFLLEARAAAAVEHDHIIPIFEVNEDRSVPFIAMPFLRGESLEDRLKRQRKLPVDETLRIAKEIAEGLGAAHERNMIHRDIKPANIWLEGDKGRVKILDFGLARSVRGESNLTQQGAIIGTPAYMAPEQGAGKKVDTRCDLFSLGCVLYRMATGTLPFKGTDTVSTLVAVATENPTAPRKLNPELSPRLSKLIMDLLAKDAEERPPSALSVVDLIEELEKGPSEAVTEILEELPARGRAGRADDDFDDRTQTGSYYDDEVMEHPAKRSMLPLFLGCGGLGLVLLVGCVIGLIVLLKKDDKTDVAQNPPPTPINNTPLPKPVDPTPKPPLDMGKAGSGDTIAFPPPVENDPIRIRPRPKPRKDATDPDKTFSPYTSPAKGLAFASDGKHFFSFGERNTRVDYWSLDDGKILRSFELGATVRHLAISSDGSRLIAYNTGRLLCWDVDGGQPLVTVTPPAGGTIVGGGFTADKDVRAAINAKAPGGSIVFIYDHAGGAIIPIIDPKTKKPVVDKRTKQAVWQPFPHEAEVERVFFSPDGKRFVSWSKDHMLRLFDIEKLKSGKFTGSPGEAKAIAVSTDFSRVMGAFGQAGFHIYDVEEGKELRDIEPEGIGNTDALAFGGGNNVGVAARFGGPTRVYDLDDGSIKKEVKGVAFTTSIALSPDGKTILCGEMSGKIHIFKLKE